VVPSSTRCAPIWRALGFAQDFPNSVPQARTGRASRTAAPRSDTAPAGSLISRCLRRRGDGRCRPRPSPAARTAYEPIDGVRTSTIDGVDRYAIDILGSPCAWRYFFRGPNSYAPAPNKSVLEPITALAARAYQPALHHRYSADAGPATATVTVGGSRSCRCRDAAPPGCSRCHQLVDSSPGWQSVSVRSRLRSR